MKLFTKQIALDENNTLVQVFFCNDKYPALQDCIHIQKTNKGYQYCFAEDFYTEDDPFCSLVSVEVKTLDEAISAIQDMEYFDTGLYDAIVEDELKRAI